MLAVFRYSFKRMIYSKSTLILTILAIGLFSLTIFVAPFFIKDIFDVKGEMKGLIITIFNNYFETICWLLLPVFCVTKINNIIAEERENETLLLIIAKPISRVRFILEKFLAYFVVIFLWLFAMTSTLIIMIYLTLSNIESIPLIVFAFPKMLTISFVLTFVFTSFYFVVSLYKKPAFNISFALLTSLSFSFFHALALISILKNSPYQDYGGKVVPRNEVSNLVRGANEYRAFYRFLNVEGQWRYIYYNHLSSVYKKYNIDNPSVEYQGQRFFLFNNEVLLKETRILQKDKLNRRTFKNEFIVVGYKEWFKQRDLYIFYSLMFVMSLTSGAYIFLKKDIF